MAELVGLVPCAGRATRLGALPCSKELYPLQGGPDDPPRPVLSWLLDGLVEAGAGRALLVLREGKWDIPAWLTANPVAGIELAYRVVPPTPSLAHSVAAAAPWLESARAAFGFPDILFAPSDAIARVARRQEETGADAVLGLVATDRPEKADIVECDRAGRLLGIRVKPKGRSRAATTWMHAVWSPALTAFWHDFVARHPTGRLANGRELYPSDVFVAAVKAGLRVECLTLQRARYLDIGTPRDLARSARFLRR